MAPTYSPSPFNTPPATTTAHFQQQPPLTPPLSHDYATLPNQAPPPSAFAHSAGHKRRADDSPPSQSYQASPDTLYGAGHSSKRRRPNLQTGFATMSISPRDGNSAATLANESDESEVEASRQPSDGVHVQYLPDKSISPIQARRRTYRPKHVHRTSSFSSASPSDEEYDSDAVYRVPHERARLQHLHEAAQQPSEIEHPSPADHSQGPLVEPIDSPVKRKHRSIESVSGRSFDDLAPSLKRQRSEMPDTVDMDTAMGDWPHIDSGPGWYEPEKDRIVVTSLSSPEHSRSPSPDSGTRRAERERERELERQRAAYSFQQNQHLAQPGDGGFTISPSLLTHIIGAQRETMVPSAPRERGLVLYRPMGPPGMGSSSPPDIVKQWDGDYVDSGRFEMIDDDEETMNPEPQMQTEPEVQMDAEPVQQWNGPTWGGAGTGEGVGGGDGDVAMDMD